MLFTLTYFFLTRTLSSSSAGKQKVVVIAVFFSISDHIPLTVQRLLRGYYSVRIGFNMINKRYILPIVYTMLIKIC